VGFNLSSKRDNGKNLKGLILKDNSIIRFASRKDQLPPYLFGMINKLKMEKRRNGDDVIDLGMGNPMDPTPDAVIEKLVEVAKDPKAHRYPESSGMKNLKLEVAKYYQRHYNVDLNPDKEAYFTIGSKEGISHLFGHPGGRYYCAVRL